MRIAVISDWFSEKMGYAENFLPKALAACGHEVHVVTSDAQVYFDSPFYAETYEPFIGPPLVAPGVKRLDGYTLHRLPHGRWPARPWRGQLFIGGLPEALEQIRPDIVQTFDVASPSSYQASRARSRVGYQLFLETHVHASVWGQVETHRPLRSFLKSFRLKRWLLGRYISSQSVKCYPISTDSAEIVTRHMGMQKSKIEICSLGVDDQMFRPPTSGPDQECRTQLRRELGFAPGDIVCVYTGRVTADKGPLLLAQAVDILARRGERFRGLFVGAGRAEDVAAIGRCAGCRVHPFVPTRELPPFYWAADIGVWPKQESTSQLDAMASGLPIILSDRVEVRERVDGNGLYYREGDAADLATQIKSLESADQRQRLGSVGQKKIADHYTWQIIAERRLQDYAASLGTPTRGTRTK